MSAAVPLNGIHHVELAVGNALQAAFFYRRAFGFRLIAYQGPETGCRERVSYVLEQGRIRFVVTAPLSGDHEFAAHHRLHGDGVRDVAFRVDDVDAVYSELLARGAVSALEPQDSEDKFGRVRRAAVRTYGDTIHSLVAIRDYEGPFLPGFERRRDKTEPVGLRRIDHVVGNVEDGKMDVWVDFYRRVFGFDQFLSFDDKDISTEYTALRSKVMTSPGGAIKMPINEPAEGLRKSQIQEYLDFYKTPGVQHVALFTDDIIGAVSKLRRRGVDFLRIPDTYYETLWDRVGEIQEDRDEIRKLGILVDRDDQGYLLQIFTNAVQDRPTLFFEIIQRRGAQGFGKGNFKALFVSLEREQGRRGNL